jgi:hypothetical protein
MSEEILKVFLEDLKTIRFVCQHCSAIIEMDVQSLQARIQENACPLCHETFNMSGSVPSGQSPKYQPLHELAKAFRYLESVKHAVKIEFPVKIKSEAKL